MVADIIFLQAGSDRHTPFHLFNLMNHLLRIPHCEALMGLQLTPDVLRGKLGAGASLSQGLRPSRQVETFGHRGTLRLFIYFQWRSGTKLLRRCSAQVEAFGHRGKPEAFGNSITSHPALRSNDGTPIHHPALRSNDGMPITPPPPLLLLHPAPSA